MAVIRALLLRAFSFHRLMIGYSNLAKVQKGQLLFDQQPFPLQKKPKILPVFPFLALYYRTPTNTNGRNFVPNPDLTR